SQRFRRARRGWTRPLSSLGRTPADRLPRRDPAREASLVAGAAPRAGRTRRPLRRRVAYRILERRLPLPRGGQDPVAGRVLDAARRAGELLSSALTPALFRSALPALGRLAMGVPSRERHRLRGGARAPARSAAGGLARGCRHRRCALLRAPPAAAGEPDLDLVQPGSPGAGLFAGGRRAPS